MQTTIHFNGTLLEKRRFPEEQKIKAEGKTFEEVYRNVFLEANEIMKEGLKETEELVKNYYGEKFKDINYINIVNEMFTNRYVEEERWGKWYVVKDGQKLYLRAYRPDLGEWAFWNADTEESVVIKEGK